MAVELYDEHEQGERVRKWIREYGVSIVTGLVLAVGGIFGFRYWQDQQAEQQMVAASLFSVIQAEVEQGRHEEARAQFEALQSQAPRSAFTGLSAMMLASAMIEDGRLESAARLYREILEQRRMESLWPVTRLRLARVLEAQGDLSEALELLEAVEPPPGHEPAWAELRGDLLLGLDRPADARAAFEDALQAGDDGAMTRRLLQMKIDAIGQSEENLQS